MRSFVTTIGAALQRGNLKAIIILPNAFKRPSFCQFGGFDDKAYSQAEAIHGVRLFNQKRYAHICLPCGRREVLKYDVRTGVRR